MPRRGRREEHFRKLEHFFRCEGLAFMHFSFQFFYHNVLYKKSGVTKKTDGHPYGCGWGSFVTPLLWVTNKWEYVAGASRIFVSFIAAEDPNAERKKRTDDSSGLPSGGHASSSVCIRKSTPPRLFSRFSVFLSFFNAESAMLLHTRPIVTWRCRLLNMAYPFRFQQRKPDGSPSVVDDSLAHAEVF